MKYLLDTRAWIWPVLALLFAQLAACGRPPRNVVLISIDTLRPDRLGCYGYPRRTSPHIDRLCGESVVFEQAISQAPSTLPSHASLFTSLPPHLHGASIAARRPLAAGLVTLAEVLQRAGFRTAAFTAGAQLGRRWGLDRGFDGYEVHREGTHSFAPIVDTALDWLAAEERQEGPFFLFLHTYEVHHPYRPAPADLARFAPPGYDGWLGKRVEIRELQWINDGGVTMSREDLALIEAAYDAEIRSMDRSLGRFVAALAERDLLDTTLLVVTSDHGEELGEHGKVGWHSHTLYDELLRVPLLLRFPGGRWAGQRVSRQVRLVDLSPTIAEAVGVAAPSTWQGVSLLPLVAGRPSGPLPALGVLDTRGEPPFSLRTERWKWYGGRLFDLRSDAGEVFDVSSLHPELARALEAKAETLVTGSPKEPGEEMELDEEAVKALEALGYL